MTNWALLVVCQLVHSYRPETPLTPLVPLVPPDPPCRQVDVANFCAEGQVKLEAGDCLHLAASAAQKAPSKRSERKRRWRMVKETVAAGKGCDLQGPKGPGPAVLYGLNGTVSLQNQGPWRITGRLHFHHVRLEAPKIQLRDARLAFYNTSTEKEGGAMYAGRSLQLINSTLQVFSSTAAKGGAIALSSRGQLRCDESLIVTERTNATKDGGSIYSRNVRLEKSTIDISFSGASKGGGMVADLLVARRSSISVSNGFAYQHGAGTYSHKRLVLIDSWFVGKTLDASQTMASVGGGIYAFHVELRNSSVEIDDAASGFNGGCIYAVRSMEVRGSQLSLSRCRAKGQGGATHVGAELQLVNSSMTCRNSSAQSSGALHAEKVLLTSSRMDFSQIRSQVPPVSLEVSIFKMEGSSKVSLLGMGEHQGFSAIELSAPANEPRSFDMSADSSLLITDFFSGILSDGGLVRLRNAELKRLHLAVEMPRADTLDVADAQLEDVNDLAFSCGSCGHLTLRRVAARRVGALLRAAEVERWSLQDVQARCFQRSQVACVQLTSALIFLDPQPWRLENVSLEAENVSSDFAPVLLDVEGPKVKGSHSSINATCPAGSFSFTQESGSSISKTAELVAMFEMMRGATISPNMTKCCASTRTLPRMQRFLKQTFDFEFGIIPEMNIACDPATFPCVCTTNMCDRQILKTSLVSTRVSCMSCPMGQYSLTPYTRALKGDNSGLLGSSGSAVEGDCITCTGVVSQVGKMPICAGRKVRVPRGIMALQGDDSSRLQFYRCPNSAACLGGNMVAENTTLQRCATGYDDRSAGCTLCASGYGRQNLDPFECVTCGRWDLSVLYFLLLPVVPLLLAVRSASQTEKERMSMVIKVILSFGTFLATIQNILEQTGTYRELRTHLKVALGLLEAEGEAGGATLLSASFDCLMGGTATRWHFLALQSFHSLAFLLLFLLLELVGLMMGSKAFGASWVRRTLVLGNAFLPAIFAAFLQWAPCFHMSKRPDGSFESFAVFQVTEMCGERTTAKWMPVLGLLLFLLFGPFLWAFMVTQSRRWKDRKEYIGFLIAGYNSHCEWWEITVLLRKSLLIGSLVLLPVSYAPMSLVIVTVLIMLAALVGHLAMRPYVDPLMNLLEGSVLTYSMLALILTLYLMSESWTNTNKTLVFFILLGSNAVTCLVLLVVFLLIALRPRQESLGTKTSGSTAPAG